MAEDLKDFISLDSSLTPGIAGALTTSLALPLVSSFTVLKFPWVALGLSFILSLVIFAATRNVISLLKRCLYCLLNTLIIFAIAFGAYSQINKPPISEPIPQNWVALACDILDKVDKAQLTADNKEFIESLLKAHEGPASVSWLDLLGPSPALAQPAAGKPPAPRGAPGASVGKASPLPNPTPHPAPSTGPNVTQKDLEKAKQYEQEQQKIRKKQNNYQYQSTF